MGVPALRRHLASLVLRGWPLTSEEDHPHVWWSVPKGWFPGAVAFGPSEVADLVRQLSRMPRSASRDRLLRHVLETAPRVSMSADDKIVVTPSSTEAEQRHLDLAQDSASSRQSLHFRYYTASRGAAQWRHASVQRVAVGPPPRMLALCHRDRKLKWFRVADVFEAKLDPHEPYEAVRSTDVDELVAQSVGGFHSGGQTTSCSFFVSEPEARWVERNLPGELKSEALGDGIRVTTTTGGLMPLARFVVGLGAAARVETPELAHLVEELALGALAKRVPKRKSRKT